MFTGIVQGLATVAEMTDLPGLRSFTLDFPPGFDAGLEIGASVACDGVCLTVTRLPAPGRACLDVMQHAPAAGRGLAELMLTGRFDSLDLSAFSPQRVLAGQAFVEQAII